MIDIDSFYCMVHLQCLLWPGLLASTRFYWKADWHRQLYRADFQLLRDATMDHLRRQDVTAFANSTACHARDGMDPSLALHVSHVLPGAVSDGTFFWLLLSFYLL